MPATPAARVLGPAARAERRPLAAATLLGVLGVGLELARPWPMALAIDYAIAGRSLGGLAPGALLALAAVAVVALSAAAGLVDMAVVTAAERAAERVGAQLRQDVFDRAVTLSLRWHDRMRSGEVVSRLTTDVGRLLDALVAVASTLVPDAVRLLVMVALLLTIDAPLGLIALLVVPVLAVFAVRQRRLVRAAQQDARAESGRFTALAADLVRNVRAIQAFDRSASSRTAFGRRNDALRSASIRAVTVESRWAPVADIVLAVGSGLVLAVGGQQVLAGRMSTGQLVVVTTYVSALYSPVRGLSRLSGVLAKSAASAARIGEVLNSTERIPESPTAVAAPRVRDGVRFAGVRFGYGPDRPVLDGFDLDLPAGTTTCLLGPSGAGKSTILQLLLRLHDVDAGAVLVDGVDVRDIAQQSLRSRIAFVPQDPWLFDATLADNIAFGSRQPARHRVHAAGRAALVDEFAGRLPHGYDTALGEGGARLSGGQRRRVALARAALSDAPIVLLDEPTASLDERSARQVVAAIRRATCGRTVLLVTHDRDLAEIADRIVVLGHDTRTVLPDAAGPRRTAPLIALGGR